MAALRSASYFCFEVIISNQRINDVDNELRIYTVKSALVWKN